MLKDLTYHVVVIDDEIDLYEDYVDYIEEKLESEGYLLKHERYENLSDLEGKELKDVDLFLVDLKFGKEDLGPAFIKKIRENYLTDILFYSSDAKAIQNNKKSGEYQGVFFATRDEYRDEIYGLLEQLLNKMVNRSNTPLSSRGIVLGSVAELDICIKKQVSELLVKVAAQKELMNKCTQMYYNSFKGQSKKINDFWKCDFHKGMRQWSEIKDIYEDFDIVELVENVKITDSNKNFKVLLELYKEINGKNDTYKRLSKFTNLLEDRNILAHVQEEVNEDGNYQFKCLNGRDYLILTDDVCRNLRSSIIEYAKLINEISN